GGTALEAPWRHPDDPVTDTGPAIDPDAVPHLTGYGPITPMTARALAAGGIWRRLVTDPLSGRLLDLGHTRYRPSAPLADHVRARDQHCVRPGCSAPARDCQLDHTRPWDHQEPTAGGSTSPANLGPLCHRDHQVKTHGDFQVVQTAPGEFEWPTPTGHRYRRNVDGSSTPPSPSPQIPPFSRSRRPGCGTAAGPAELQGPRRPGASTVSSAVREWSARAHLPSTSGSLRRCPVRCS